MSDDSNPFRPALSKPVDDTVLANDPAPDNFMAGNDSFGQRNVAGQHSRGNNLASHQPVRLDQMTAASVSQANQAMSQTLNQAAAQTMGQPINQTVDQPVGMTPSITMPTGLDLNNNDLNNSFGLPTAVPVTDTKSAKNKKGLLSSLRRKKQSSSSASTASPFGQLDQANADVANSVFGSPATADSTSNEPLGFNPLDPSATPTDPVTDPASNNFGGQQTQSPLEAGLSAAAAVTADGSESLGQSTNLADQPSKRSSSKKASNKAGSQPKQLTVSVLTIVFGVLFLASSALAATFFVQKNGINSQLEDAQAKLSKLQDQSNSSTNSTNKASTQFDSLQTKIEELTKTNQENSQTIENNKKTIDDLNKRNSDLTNQLTAAQNKLTADTSVSDNMKSLVTTMCAAGAPYNTSSACVALGQGSGAAQAATPTATTNNQQQ